MAATSADRRKVAVLGTCRGDWLCIGTSFDALGAGGASPPPAPTLQNPGSRVLRGVSRCRGVSSYVSLCGEPISARLDGDADSARVDISWGRLFS